MVHKCRGHAKGISVFEMVPDFVTVKNEKSCCYLDPQG